MRYVLNDNVKELNEKELFSIDGGVIPWLLLMTLGAGVVANPVTTTVWASRIDSICKSVKESNSFHEKNYGAKPQPGPRPRSTPSPY